MSSEPIDVLVFQGRRHGRDAVYAAWLAGLRAQYGDRVVEVARGLVRIRPLAEFPNDSRNSRKDSG